MTRGNLGRKIRLLREGRWTNQYICKDIERQVFLGELIGSCPSEKETPSMTTFLYIEHKSQLLKYISGAGFGEQAG